MNTEISSSLFFDELACSSMVVRTEGRRGLFPVVFQLLGNRVVGVFGPGQPEILDFDAVKHLPGVIKSGQVVGMLMSGHHEVEPMVGGRGDIRNHGLHSLPPIKLVLGVGVLMMYATIDEHVAGATIFRPKGQQQAIAESGVVQAHRDSRRGRCEGGHGCLVRGRH